MTLEGLRGYLLLANGLTEVTRRRASAVARSMLASGSQAAGGLLPDPVKTTVATMTDELVATGRANRELLVGLVRGEIDRAVTRLGLVGADELDALTREVTLLQARLARLEAEVAAGSSTRTATTRTTSKRAATTRTASKRTATKQSAPTKRSAPMQAAPPAQASPVATPPAEVRSDEETSS